ncbi:MAG: hypothetical protein JWR80_7690 [Bradyrhizobium sp.]|nr:hypothetical protein [Bradyrhizobium sp.]
MGAYQERNRGNFSPAQGKRRNAFLPPLGQIEYLPSLVGSIAILCRLVTALPTGKRSTILLGPSFYGDVSITNEFAQAFPFTHHVGTKFDRRHRPWHVTDRFHALREIGRVHYACD